MKQCAHFIVLSVGLFLLIGCQSPVDLGDQTLAEESQAEVVEEVEFVPTVSPTAEIEQPEKDAEPNIVTPEPTVQEQEEVDLADNQLEVVQVVEAEDLSEPTSEEESDKPAVTVEAPIAEAPLIIRLDQLPKASELADNHLYSFIMRWDGVDLKGMAGTYAYEISVADQTQPEKAYRAEITVRSTDEPDYLTQTALIGGTNYYFSEDSGCFSFPFDDTKSDWLDSFAPPINDLVDVEGALVEAGIMIEGVLTDQYSFDPLAAIPEEDSGADELEFLEASAYVTREDKYIVRFHVVATGLPTEAFEDFDVNKEGTLTMIIDYKPALEPLHLSPPAECVNEASRWDGFPQLEDAFEVVETPTGLYYKSAGSKNDIEGFYQDQLVADGWTWTNGETFVNGDDLLFTKEGETVRVSNFEMGDSISVSITVEA